MKKIYLLILIYSLSVFAEPEKVEMIFLTPKKLHSLIESINNFEKLKVGQKIAANEMEGCAPMGDGCFHPQYGYIENSEVKSEPKLIDQNLKLETINATETQMINCEKDHYFDIFCGKTGKEKPRANVEVWFDVSSSLKTVDSSSNPDFCDRRSFMQKLIEACGDNISFSVYNTSKKVVGDHSQVCMSYGTNDEKKLLRWIKELASKELLIVTDVDELSKEMREFLDSKGAKIIGEDSKGFNSTDLVNYAKDFSKRCK